jgi:hypothetical protein
MLFDDLECTGSVTAARSKGPRQQQDICKIKWSFFIVGIYSAIHGNRTKEIRRSHGMDVFALVV